MKKSQKPPYLKVRFPKISKIGGSHQTAKGGKYRRSLEKKKTRQEIKADLE